MYKIVDEYYYCIEDCFSENLKYVNDSRPYCTDTCLNGNYLLE